MIVMESPELTQQRLGTILVVEDDSSLRRLTQVQLEKLGYQTRIAVDVNGGVEILRREAVDLVICDLHLPAASGLELLKKVRAEYPETKFVIVTAYGSVNTAIEAMKLGAYDYLAKPLHPVELRTLVERVLEQQRLIDEVQVLRGNVDRKYGFHALIGESTSLRSVIDLASRAARTDAPVLITGETGTGKELMAKAIHFNSARRDRPFIVVNCGSIPRDLVESELFGHVKGSFTGAVAHKQGRVEMAAGGTLFLDEIGEMPLEMQVRLLRLIQEGEIQKVGATNASRVDVRIIAATHRNLEDLIRVGAFREDLYYRLAVIPVEVPPLRQRIADIPELVQYFFKEGTKKHHREELRIPASLFGYFCQYDWPGNVRQLANCITRIVVLAPGPEITVRDLPDFLRNIGPPKSLLDDPDVPELRSEDMTLDAVDRKVIYDAMERVDWNQTNAARHLGVSRKVLRGRLERYGLRKPKGPPAPQK
jgi:two-component system, NtrC family, response regulator